MLSTFISRHSTCSLRSVSISFFHVQLSKCDSIFHCLPASSLQFVFTFRLYSLICLFLLLFCSCFSSATFHRLSLLLNGFRLQPMGFQSLSELSLKFCYSHIGGKTVLVAVFIYTPMKSFFSFLNPIRFLL